MPDHCAESAVVLVREAKPPQLLIAALPSPVLFIHIVVENPFDSRDSEQIARLPDSVRIGTFHVKQMSR